MEDNLTTGPDPEVNDIASSTTDANCASGSSTELVAAKNCKSEPRSKGPGFIRCDYCPNIYAPGKPIQEHINRFHRHQVKKCTYCKKCFKTEQERSVHIQETHETEPIICIYCNEGVQNNVAQHMASRHRKEVIKCSRRNCVTFFKTNEEQQQHFKQIHVTIPRPGEGFKCLYCELAFEHLGTVLRHAMRDHGEIICKCTFARKCRKYFKTQSELQTHLWEIHQQRPSDQKHRCRLCRYETKQERFLPQHYLQVHGSLAVDCFFCRKIFKTKDLLSDHYLRIHAEKD